MSECKISNESFEVKEKGKTNRVLLNGYWIWWCYEHNQPWPWCKEDIAKKQRDDLLAVCKDVQWRVYDYATVARCPSCMNRKENGHTHDCKLNTAIAKAEEKP